MGVFVSSSGMQATEFTAQKNVAHAIPGSQAFLLKSGQKLQYTIAGSTGTGSMTCTIAYFPVTSGATLA